jgi:hypothetical protein
VKEDTLDIHMMNIPSKMSNKGKNQLNQVHPCNRGNIFSVFNAFLLRKSLHDEVCFMSLNNTVRGEFGLVDPSKLHNVISMSLRNKVPGVIL